MEKDMQRKSDEVNQHGSVTCHQGCGKAYLCFQSYWILSKLRLQDEKRRFQRHPEYYSKHTQDCFNAVTSQIVQDGSLSVQDDNLNSASLSRISENVISYISGCFAKRYVLAKHLRLCYAK
ncbi:unnamed protein product [Larinioides sclopetarius]|uniref:Uncharacterized protein n=1 Tax=Larinioides sclopetarius TaxID=280406 RepID=A0AAV2BBR8_9ARAC